MMNEYTAEQLREWAAYLRGRGTVWTLPEGMPKPSEVYDAHAALIEENERLRSALVHARFWANQYDEAPALADVVRNIDRTLAEFPKESS